MKRIFITNIPAVGTFNLATFDVYTAGAVLPVGENLAVDYNTLTVEQKENIDDFVNLMFNQIPA